ncbi:entericidin EcnA/B family protein [Sagittula salina]|uniref:Entericidin EcnA/B family protein n=1 Tax=Sagittula salina TaxID=2820268 RepID=A0A940MNX9_9RHOB|nr:entericidin EcnA/B family protein [Sagittula salina]MBP0482086.1 entericidin EcnA/B family protein [Sagittula salina]
MKTVFLLAGLLLTLALSGCGTVDGLGQDISAGARTVQGWM